MEFIKEEGKRYIVNDNGGKIPLKLAIIMALIVLPVPILLCCYFMQTLIAIGTLGFGIQMLFEKN